MCRETKTCAKCHEEKPIVEFGKCAKNKDGKKTRCKKCRNKDNKIYRKTKIGYKEIAKEYMAKRRLNNPAIREKERKNTANYRKYNSEKVKIAQANWKTKNKEHRKQYAKEEYKKNKKYYCLKNKERRKNLSDGYVAYTLHIPLKELHKSLKLLETKRMQLKLLRECKKQFEEQI